MRLVELRAVVANCCMFLVRLRLSRIIVRILLSTIVGKDVGVVKDEFQAEIHSRACLCRVHVCDTWVIKTC